MTTTLQHWQGRITAVAFTSLTGAFGLNLAIGQFIAPLMDSLAWSLAATSTVVAVNTLAWGLFQPLAGRLIDRIGPRQVMAGSASLMGLSYVTLATVTEYWQFLILFGVVVAAGFAGCSSMPSSVLVARWHTKSRPRALAVSSMGINAGQLLLLPLAGVLVTMLGWRAAFLALGAIMLALVVPVLWFGARNSPSDVGIRSDGTLEPAGAPTTLRDALSDRQFWTISLSFAGCGYSLYLFTTHMPKLALELSGSPSTGGWLMALVALCSAASMWLTGQWAAKRWGKRVTLIVLHTARAVSFTVLALAPSLPAFILGVVMFGLSSFPVIPLTTGLVADRFGGTAMGGILGSSWLIHQIFAALGVLLGGLLRDATGSYSASFASGAAVLIASTVLTWLISERRFQVRPSPTAA